MRYCGTTSIKSIIRTRKLPQPAVIVLHRLYVHVMTLLRQFTQRQDPLVRRITNPIQPAICVAASTRPAPTHPKEANVIYPLHVSTLSARRLFAKDALIMKSVMMTVSKIVCWIAGFDRRDLNNSSFAGFDAELFGDQTTETFGLGNCLPPLPMQKASVKSNCFDLSSKDASLPAPIGRAPRSTGHVPPGNSLCSDDGYRDRPNSVLVSSLRTRTAADRTVSTCAPLCHDSFNGGRMAGNSSPTRAPLKPLSRRQSTDTAGDNVGLILSTDDARAVGFDVHIENPADKKSIVPSASCQWMDGNGQPCGHVVPMGDKMHEHLQTVHGVKNEVFCRWLGCRVGISGASPHHYAKNVQRHTWGHSGYRPYKCPTCLKSFAAAKVLEEHVTNFHLQQKAFDCNTCAHRCTSAANLKRHMDEKHRAERFQCEFCNRNGRVKLFPRGSNLARHFRICKYVLASFPDDNGAVTGKMADEWFPPGYRGGNHGMDRAKITPPNYLPALSGT